MTEHFKLCMEVLGGGYPTDDQALAVAQAVWKPHTDKLLEVSFGALESKRVHCLVRLFRATSALCDMYSQITLTASLNGDNADLTVFTDEVVPLIVACAKERDSFAVWLESHKDTMPLIAEGWFASSACTVDAYKALCSDLNRIAKRFKGEARRLSDRITANLPPRLLIESATLLTELTSTPHTEARCFHVCAFVRTRCFERASPPTVGCIAKISIH